ncbi:SusD/RagB family nutrient-binding outer membrane lipoprotein [Dyadobacter sp. CY261]|uniref:SusD/RagB family nutrient-binding outer membrane lipoprotein n=1 Tax=Dyadobacter sp. CY261 TaxID=2907203 RepID=UPI001F1D1FF7|nr:SusD/RagB family nutrient-binding outer membrane lipoprotein [Dyadobacter sp. CY261]MCF0074083.1 SusD/RagB family nutrient-binding outer membrane lipoprotein [Dyadobacter sp. CY261]
MTHLYRLSASALAGLLLLAGCQDLTEINQNPNELTDNKVNPAYVLTSVLSGSASELSDVAFAGNVTQRVVPEAMQYTQRDFLEYSITNQFAWTPLTFDYRNLYQPLANASYLETRAAGNVDSLFIKGTAKVMQAYWFGLQTSMWGDIPYSEAFQGTANLQPAFDEQKNIFAGLLKDLDEANTTLEQARSVQSSVMKKADILYAGDLLKWRKFANSLRLRYLMRVSEKAADMNALGVNVAAEFAKIVADPAKYPIITETADNAAVGFPGTNTIDSWTQGPLVTTTESEFYRVKAASTIVEHLKSNLDPRLTVWFRPVEVQTLVRDKGADVVFEKDASGAVKRYVKSYQAGLDTSLYVGLKIALTDPDSYNNNAAAHRTQAIALNSGIYNSGAANPFVSYLGTMYRTNTHPLVKAVFIPAAEVHFLLAEAVLKGWIAGDTWAHASAGIAASLSQYGITNGDTKVYNPVSHTAQAFDQTAFLQRSQTAYKAAANPLEWLMQQKWLSAFSTMEGWFDWRRTGFPDLGKNVTNGAQGSKIPVRYIYGESEINYNPANTNQAISRLSPATNNQWSKMWLIEGTSKPW